MHRSGGGRASYRSQFDKHSPSLAFLEPGQEKHDQTLQQDLFNTLYPADDEPYTGCHHAFEKKIAFLKDFYDPFVSLCVREIIVLLHPAVYVCLSVCMHVYVCTCVGTEIFPYMCI